MTTISIGKLQNLLAQKLGSDTAENLTTFITEKIKEDVETATKDFVRAEIQSSKSDMIKWLVGLFITLALMIIGLYGTIIFGGLLKR